MQKTYGVGDGAWVRMIAKPVAGSVRIAVAGREQAIGSAVSVDATTGLVRFAAGAIPVAGAQVTAGFLFHVPVRFDSDSISVDLAQFAAGRIPAIPLVEIRP